MSGNEISNNLSPVMDTTYLCQECGLSFKELWMMQEHNRISHDERVHHCETCKIQVVGLKKFTDYEKET